MTAIELIQLVQDLISEETYDRFSKAEILRWLNRGLEDISIKTGYLSWKWLISTVVDKREYPYPAEALRLFRLEYNNEPLPPCDIPTLDRVSEEDGTIWLTETGPPQNWYHSWNRAYGIYPTPDAIYAIYGYGFSKAGVLSDDADIPLIPDQFHRTPALFAAYNIKREDGDLTVMGSLRSEYYNPSKRAGMIQDMIEEKLAIEKKGTGYRVGYSRSIVEEGG